MFRSTVLGCAAGLLLALDGFHLVLSRTALLDIFLLFFVLAAFGALVLDRDARRRRWAAGPRRRARPEPAGPGRPAADRLAHLPWWRLAAGGAARLRLRGEVERAVLPAGLRAAGIFWEVGVRRSAGVRRPWRDALLDELPWLVLAWRAHGRHLPGDLVGWLLTDDGYYRHSSPTRTPGQRTARHRRAAEPLGTTTSAAFGSTTSLDDAAHVPVVALAVAAAGPPGGLLLVRRPACGAPSCAVGDPAAGHAAALVVVPAGAGRHRLARLARRDWRAGAILLTVRRRPAAVVLVRPRRPDDVLLLRRAGRAVPGAGGGLRARRDDRPAGGDVGAVAPLVPGDPSYERRFVGGIAAGAYVLLVGLCFAYFYPIFVGKVHPVLGLAVADVARRSVDISTDKRRAA